MNWYQKMTSWFILSIGKINWKGQNLLVDDELATIRGKIIPDYYIILTHRDNHLSTFFTDLMNWIFTKKWGYWSHALMNMEDEVKEDSDFRLVEAVSSGVKYTPFDDVFDVQGVVLLKPKNMSIDRWTLVLEKAKAELGKPYDTLFDIANDNALSCVELVRTALMAEPDYLINFANFEALIAKHNNLTPQMYYDCGDFVPVYEVRHK